MIDTYLWSFRYFIIWLLAGHCSCIPGDCGVPGEEATGHAGGGGGQSCHDRWEGGHHNQRYGQGGEW